MKNSRLMHRSSGLAIYLFFNSQCDFAPTAGPSLYFAYFHIAQKKTKKHKHLQSRCCAIVRVSIRLIEF